jgi:hypothetical protein
MLNMLNWLENSKSHKIVVKSYENAEIGWNRVKSWFCTLFYVFKRNIYTVYYTAVTAPKGKNLAS